MKINKCSKFNFIANIQSKNTHIPAINDYRISKLSIYSLNMGDDRCPINTTENPIGGHFLSANQLHNRICVIWKSTTFNAWLNPYISCNDIVNNLSSFSQWSTLLSACIPNDQRRKKTIHSVIVSSLSFHCQMVF